MRCGGGLMWCCVLGRIHLYSLRATAALPLIYQLKSWNRLMATNKTKTIRSYSKFAFNTVRSHYWVLVDRFSSTWHSHSKSNGHRKECIWIDWAPATRATVRIPNFVNGHLIVVRRWKRAGIALPFRKYLFLNQTRNYVFMDGLHAIAVRHTHTNAATV